MIDRENTVEIKQQELIHWKKELAAHWDGKKTTDILHAFVVTCHAYSIPRELGFALIDGLEKDLYSTHHADFDSLYEYCYAAGGIPGLFMAHVVNAPRELHSSAVALGMGMQLTNILRDIKEDDQNGRMYLPLAELEQFGCSTDDIRKGHVTDPFQTFVAFQIARARAYYADAEKVLSSIEPESRLTIHLCLAYYREILAQIERKNYDVFSSRVFVSDERKKELLNESIIHMLRSTDSLKKPVRE